MSKDSDFRECAHRLIPGGAHTYSRGDDQLPISAPAAFVRGKGARVWDLNGREYVDWGMGINNVLIGHAEPEIDEAVIKAIRDGVAFSRPSPLEVEAAEAVLSLFPGMDMIKFGKNGSDANTAGIRLARAITGRDLVAYDASAPFLSIHDWFIGTTVLNSGVPEAVKRLSVPFRYNDLASAEQMFADHPNQIAVLVMEVCREKRPVAGFLEGIRRLCNENGTLLLFDEMVTGYRYHLNGAYTMFGVTPDLLSIGKGMANGYAITALLGKREYMERGGLRTDKERVFLLSTTNGPERGALAAAIATAKFYHEQDVIGHIAQTGQRLIDGLAGYAAAHGIGGHVSSVSDFACRPVPIYRNGLGHVSMPLRTLFLQELLKLGVFMPWVCASYRHRAIALEQTFEALDHACHVYSLALDEGVARSLSGRSVKPVFRKFN